MRELLEVLDKQRRAWAQLLPAHPELAELLRPLAEQTQHALALAALVESALEVRR